MPVCIIPSALNESPKDLLENQYTYKEQNFSLTSTADFSVNWVEFVEGLIVFEPVFGYDPLHAVDAGVDSLTTAVAKRCRNVLKKSFSLRI